MLYPYSEVLAIKEKDQTINMQQIGWILTTLCGIEKANFKKLYTAYFLFYNIFTMTNYRNRKLYTEKQRNVYQKKNGGNLKVDPEFLSLEAKSWISLKCQDLELLTKMKSSGFWTPWYETDQYHRMTRR